MNDGLSILKSETIEFKLLFKKYLITKYKFCLTYWKLELIFSKYFKLIPTMNCLYIIIIFQVYFLFIVENPLAKSTIRSNYSDKEGTIILFNEYLKHFNSSLSALISYPVRFTFLD